MGQSFPAKCLVCAGRETRLVNCEVLRIHSLHEGLQDTRHGGFSWHRRPLLCHSPLSPPQNTVLLQGQPKAHRLTLVSLNLSATETFPLTAKMGAKTHLSLVSPSLLPACFFPPQCYRSLLFLLAQLCGETEYLKLSGLRAGKLSIFI